MDLDVQRLPHAEQQLVSGGLHDDAVERDAVMDLALDVVGLRRLAHALRDARRGLTARP